MSFVFLSISASSDDMENQTAVLGAATVQRTVLLMCLRLRQCNGPCYLCVWAYQTVPGVYVKRGGGKESVRATILSGDI